MEGGGSENEGHVWGDWGWLIYDYFLVRTFANPEGVFQDTFKNITFKFGGSVMGVQRIQRKLMVRIL